MKTITKEQKTAINKWIKQLNKKADEHGVKNPSLSIDYDISMQFLKLLIDKVQVK